MTMEFEIIAFDMIRINNPEIPTRYKIRIEVVDTKTAVRAARHYQAMFPHLKKHVEFVAYHISKYVTVSFYDEQEALQFYLSLS